MYLGRILATLYVFLTLCLSTTTVLGGLSFCSEQISQESSVAASVVLNCTVNIEDLQDLNINRDDVFGSVRKSLGSALPSSVSLRLSDVTLHLPLCEQLWHLAAYECTFRLSSTWPSQGLQTGRAFLFYTSLSSTAGRITGERVNVTCDPGAWDALLTSNITSGGSTADGATLLPCATAIVTTGQELLDQLAQLQLTASRVLITVAANVSLPTAPTPQRQDPAPDDSQPLARIYRNVTLAGADCLQYADGRGWSASGSGGSSSGGGGGAVCGSVQLDARMRRNAFSVDSGRQQGAATNTTTTAAASGAAEAASFRPVLMLTDIDVVGTPPGPVSSWPLGLLRIASYLVGMDRSGAGGVQMIAVRTVMLRTPQEVDYMLYWYNRLLSLNPEERQSAAWVTRVASPPQSVRDEDGYQTARMGAGDFFVIYNVSLVATPQMAPLDFTLWSLEPPEPPAAPLPPLPPSSFAVAQNTSQLLKLMQAPWGPPGGPRVILVVSNMSLRTQEGWPQAGARLTYSVTLLGPVAGPPVWLDTGGLPLVDGTAAVTVGNSSGSANNTGSLTVQLHRVQLLGFSPPLMVADPELVTAVAAAAEGGHLAGSPQLRAWADRCTPQHHSIAGLGAAPSYELRNCYVGLRPALLEVLQRAVSPDACPSAATNGTPTPPAANNTSGAPAWAPKLCALLAANYTPSSAAGRLAALAKSFLGTTGQATLAAGNAAGATQILLPAASLGGVRFVNSFVFSQGRAALAALAASGTADWNTTAVDADTTCGVEAFLAALATVSLPLLAADEVPVRHRTSSTSPPAVVVGIAVGAATCGAVVLVAAVALLLVWRRRRRRQYAVRKGQLKIVKPPEILVAQEGDSGAASAAAGTLAGRDSGSSGPDGELDNPVPGPEPGKGGGAAGGGEAVVVAVAPAAVESSPQFSDSGLTYSNLTGELAGDAASSGNRGGGGGGGKAPTMADTLRLLGGGGGGGGGGAVGVGVGAAGRDATGPVAAVAQRLGLRPPPSSVRVHPRTEGMLESIQEDIQELMRRCQATAAAAGEVVAPGDSGSGRRRMKLLGRGAFGAVFLGEWRGLPAAIKVLILGPGASSGRQERLAREVALTMTLSHPHIVPTYNHTVSPMAPSGALGSPARWPGGAGAGALPEDDYGDAADVTALELRLVMQYCEGGTLGSNLHEGKFRVVGPDAPWRELAVATSGTGGGPRPPCVGPSPGAPALKLAAGELAAPPGCGAEGPVAAGVQRAQGQEQQEEKSLTGPQQKAPQQPGNETGRDARTVDVRRGGYLGSSPPLSWSDLKPAANLLLSLLAALDVARGLEYLHACAVIHGDLTENNVLLKAVAPVLPQLTSSSTWQPQLSPATSLPPPATLLPLRTTTAPSPWQPPPTPPQTQQPQPQLPAALRLGSGSPPSDPCSPWARAGACSSAAGLSHALLSTTDSAAAASTGPLAAGHHHNTSGHMLLVGNSGTAVGGLDADREGCLVPDQPAAASIVVPSANHPGSHEISEGSEGSGENGEQAAGGPVSVAVAAAVAVAADEDLAAASSRADGTAAAAPPSQQTVWPQKSRFSGRLAVVAPAPEVCCGASSPGPSSGAGGDGATRVTRDDGGGGGGRTGGGGDTLTAQATLGAGAPGVAPGAAPSGSPTKAAAALAAAAAAAATPFAAAPSPSALGNLATAAAPPRLSRMVSHFVRDPSRRADSAAPAGGGATPFSGVPRKPASCGDADALARVNSAGTTTAAVTLPPSHRAALQLLRWSFKISDFGLSVQIHDPAQSHLSNMAQGTPFFAAPEVIHHGRLSPAADVYSFGVLLWLLLHGVSIRQIRHLLPAVPHLPIGSLLLRHASPALLPAARELLMSCLDDQPQRRPGAGQLRGALEALLRDAAGAELAGLLLGAERREHLAPGEAVLQRAGWSGG